MFINKYLNDTYLDMLYNTYEEEYINSIDENNFNKVYYLLKNKGFYFIDDIIIKYLELFSIEPKYVLQTLNDFEKEFGNNYINYIGNNMPLIQRIIDKANDYSQEDNY